MSVPLHHPFTAALGLVDHAAAPIRLFAPLTAGWPEPTVPVQIGFGGPIPPGVDADIRAFFTRNTWFFRFQALATVDTAPAPRWKGHADGGVGGAKRFERPKDARPWWVSDVSRAPDVDTWQARYAAWRANPVGTCLFHVPFVETAAEGDPWDPNPPVVARMTFVLSDMHPLTTTSVLSYVNWTAYARLALPNLTELPVPQVPAAPRADMTRTLDRHWRILRSTPGDQLALFDVYDNFCVRADMDVAFATTRAVKTAKEARSAPAIAREHAALVELLRWCFDTSVAPAVAAERMPQYMARGANPYQLMVTRDPALRHYRPFHDPRTFFV